jgi:sulfite reductase alpha subunit-like flavoprotein
VFGVGVFQKEKVYVQHRLQEIGKDIWKLVHEEKATFFVCG